MTTGQPTVFVVDDEQQARQSVCALAQSMRQQAKAFESGEAFLDYYQDEPGCLVTDYRMAGMNGLELQQRLKTSGYHLPIVIVTAYARTPMTVRAIQNGAVTLLDKPYNEDDLWQAIRKGLAKDEQLRQVHQREADLREHVDRLTTKEHKVLDLMVEGKPNKTMADNLNVSLRTIENRRRSIFAKLQVQTIAELVAMVMKLAERPPSNQEDAKPSASE